MYIITKLDIHNKHCNSRSMYLLLTTARCGQKEEIKSKIEGKCHPNKQVSITDIVFPLLNALHQIAGAV